MTATAFALFDTEIGPCAIAWNRRGVAGVQLPEHGGAATLARMRERFPDAREAVPPPGVRLAADRIAMLLRGERSDLSAVQLDMSEVPPFHRRVYQVARAIPPGETLSYGEVAARAGSPGAARAVGRALARNPFAVVVPCHRVLASGGRIGGFSASGGVETKLRLLAIEGVRPGDANDPVDGCGGLGFDARVAVARVCAADPVLARVVKAVGAFRPRLKDAPTLFAALAEAIVHQQLTARASEKIFDRLRAGFADGPGGPTPERVLGASDEQLRAAGLSRPKVLSLRDLARRTAEGGLPTLDELRGMDDESAVERLTEVRGIGRWTVEMVLIFHLGRPDVLPVDDYGVRCGFASAFGRPEPPSRKELAAHGERWRPYRTVASWYLWRAVDLAKHPAPPGRRRPVR